MRAPIAKLRISAGNPGWYDPLTNIHLTIARPEAYVYEGSNVANIKMGVAYKLINVVEGSLEKKPTAVNEEVREVIPQEIETVKEEEPIVEEKIEETSEPVKEEEKTEEVVEEPKKKTTRKKATKKETSETTEE